MGMRYDLDGPRRRALFGNGVEMKAYPQELRVRVVVAWARGGQTQPEIARRLEVGLRRVEKARTRRRETGSAGPPPHGGGRRRAFDAAAEARLRRAVAERPDATLDELRAAAGVACGRTAVWAALGRAGLTRKKSRSTPRSAAART